MTITEQMECDYNREQNYRVALAFDVDADLVDALCNSDGDDYIDDYVMRETIIETGRRIRDRFLFGELCGIVRDAYNEVAGPVT